MERKEIHYVDNKTTILALAENEKNAFKILKHLYKNVENAPLMFYYLEDMNIRGKQIELGYLICEKNLEKFCQYVEFKNDYFIQCLNMASYLYNVEDKAIKQGAISIIRNKKNNNLIFSPKEKEILLDLYYAESEKLEMENTREK